VRSTSCAVVIALAALTSCSSNDFKVLDALETGMTKAEAAKTIESFGFKRQAAVERPPNGWPETDGTAVNIPRVARLTEARLHQPVQFAEYYPVHHGLLGFGELFLFYDADGRLIHFYGHRIN
jgi:hypothetical protein